VSKKVGILGIVALALLVGSTGAFATGREGVLTVSLPGATEGALYYSSSLIPHVDAGPVSMP